MLTTYSKKIALLLLFVFAVVLLVNCVPPPATETGSVDSATKEEKKDYDENTCNRYLSFAHAYYQNQDWDGCVRNFNMMLKNNCGEPMAEDIFYFMGRAYRELKTEGDEYLDSAAFTYQKGLEYLPGNTSLIKNLAYVYRLQGNTNLEIREYEKLAERDPENIKYLQELSKLYFKVERYEDVTWAVGKILEIEPGNEQAMNDRMTAFKKLGKDIITVQKEAWEKNPTSTTGIEYASALEDKQDYQGAIDILKQLSATNSTSFVIWDKLGNNYKNLGEKENIIRTYKHIATKISPRDLNVIGNIVNAHVELAQYKEAYIWAQKAITINKNSKISNKLLGDVFYGVVEYNTSSRDINFEDKIVYKLAYDYYKKASAQGEFSVKGRIDYLKEYRIPTSEDWFMNKYDSNGKDRTSFKPLMECYNWINESASK